VNPAIPALFFLAISLLFIAYTTRFLLGLTGLARGILREHLAHPEPHFGSPARGHPTPSAPDSSDAGVRLAAILLAALSMGAEVKGFPGIGRAIFVASLAFFITSLAICVHENKLSIDAIEVEFRHARVPSE
jgi:hypothetical protein